MDSAITKEMDDCYPQLVGAILALDAGSVILTMWRAVQLLFPRRFVEKFGFAASASPEMRRRVARFISLAEVPQDFGGERVAKL